MLDEIIVSKEILETVPGHKIVVLAVDFAWPRSAGGI